MAPRLNVKAAKGQKEQMSVGGVGWGGGSGSLKHLC